MDHVKHYFSAYPASNQCYETSNKLLFHNLHDAQAHADVLHDKKVIPYKRPSPVKGANKQKSTLQKVKELIIKITAAQTEDALKSLLPRGENRRSVLAAWNKKLQSLKAAE